MGVTQEYVNIIFDLLKQLYPDAGTELVFSDPFQLLVSVILSAQCTDKQVNKVTGKLFTKYRTPADFAKLTPEALAEEIKECGLFRNKSKNIVATSKMLVERFQGEVPDDIDMLQTLPGVGRKTANVIAIVAFGKPAMPVDTHVFRLARRLGLSKGKTPEAVEKDLVALIPPENLGDAHHQLILHGRRVCRARNPLCADCLLHIHCPSANLGEGSFKEIQ